MSSAFDDTKDPEYLERHPPEKAPDPRLVFQEGEHEGKWSEFDERGVPTKNAKKRKPSKKEKDALESEFLEAKKKYQQYLKEVGEWEQQKLGAESALEKTDKLRWAFRQVGDTKAAPIRVDELEDLLRILGWDGLSRRELRGLRQSAEEIADGRDELTLEDLRGFTKTQMPNIILEERLNLDIFNKITLEEVYSPRTWRGKLENEPRLTKGSKEKSSKISSLSPRSPRGGSSPRSPRGASGKLGSTREEKKKRKDDDAPVSPRGSKEKKDKNDRSKYSSELSSGVGKEKKTKDKDKYATDGAAAGEKKEKKDKKEKK